MYFWEINKLKEEIHSRSINETSKLLYILIPMMLNYLVIDFVDLWIGQNDYDYWYQLSTVLSSILLITCTVVMFYLNGGKAGNNFLTKYFSISFVGGIRYIVFTLPIVVSYLLYITLDVDPATDPSLKPIDVVAIFIWSCGLYLYICKHIYDIRLKETN